MKMVTCSRFVNRARRSTMRRIETATYVRHSMASAASAEMQEHFVLDVSSFFLPTTAEDNEI